MDFTLGMIFILILAAALIVAIYEYSVGRSTRSWKNEWHERNKEGNKDEDN